MSDLLDGDTMRRPQFRAVIALRVVYIAVAVVANAIRQRLPAKLYLWICDRLYHEAAWLYEPTASLISAGRWWQWGARAGRGLRGTIVEIGPGTGRLLAEMRAGGALAIAIDLSDAMARRASARLPGAVARGDARAIPIRTGAVDGVIAVFPAQFARDPAFWREAARVTRIGGRMRILIDVASGGTTTGTWRLDPPTPGWRLRRVRAPSAGATLGLLLARRIALDAPPLKVPRPPRRKRLWRGRIPERGNPT